MIDYATRETLRRRREGLPAQHITMLVPSAAAVAPSSSTVIDLTDDREDIVVASFSVPLPTQPVSSSLPPASTRASDQGGRLSAASLLPAPRATQPATALCSQQHFPSSRDSQLLQLNAESPWVAAPPAVPPKHEVAATQVVSPLGTASMAVFMAQHNAISRSTPPQPGSFQIAASSSKAEAAAEAAVGSSRPPLAPADMSQEGAQLHEAPFGSQADTQGAVPAGQWSSFGFSAGMDPQSQLPSYHTCPQEPAFPPLCASPLTRTHSNTSGTY